MSEELFRQISESIRVRGERPSSVQYEEMISRGAIDREGNVLIRRPEAPTGRIVGDQPKAEGRPG